MEKSTQTAPQVIKLTWRGEMRKVEMGEGSLQEAEQLMLTLFELDNGPMRMKFKDGDGEWISITCEEDWKLATMEKSLHVTMIPINPCWFTGRARSFIPPKMTKTLTKEKVAVARKSTAKDPDPTFQPPRKRGRPPRPKQLLNSPKTSNEPQPEKALTAKSPPLTEENQRKPKGPKEADEPMEIEISMSNATNGKGLSIHNTMPSNALTSMPELQGGTEQKESYTHVQPVIPTDMANAEPTQSGSGHVNDQ
jgi:hypothetical protein